MAAGCPVIVTPEVGMASLVQEAGCGVVAAGDPANLGLEMKRLLDDHGRRQDMGKAGRRTVETKYSWNTIGKQMLDLYVDILAIGRKFAKAQTTTCVLHREVANSCDRGLQSARFIIDRPFIERAFCTDTSLEAAVVVYRLDAAANSATCFHSQKLENLSR